MKLLRISPLLMGVLLLGACVSMPKGPSVMVYPGSGKSFDQFRFDDVECRNFAEFQVGGKSSEDIAAESAAKSAVVGTAIGPAAGAALGARPAREWGTGTKDPRRSPSPRRRRAGGRPRGRRARGRRSRSAGPCCFRPADPPT